MLEVLRTEADKVDGYKVRYTGWSSRFDEWVDPERLVEPSDNNRQVQVSRSGMQKLGQFAIPLIRCVGIDKV